MRPIDADIKVSDYIETWQCECSENDTQTVMAVEDLQYLPTIDPIKAAGGCYCRECRSYVDAYGSGRMMCMRPIRTEDYSETGCMFPLEIDTKEDDFCSYGEPREAQDDG